MRNTGTLQVTTPTEREIVMTRVFDAPRSLVFDAFTKPDLLKRWFGPRGWSLVVCEVDLRVGGGFRFVLRGPDGKDMGMRGVYREIVPPERSVHVESFDDYPGESLVTAVLLEQGGKTAFTATVLYPSQQVRDIVIQSGMEHGAAESYDKLAEMLASTTRALDKPQIDQPQIDQPQIVETTAQPTATIRLTVPREEIRKVMGPGHGELMAAVAAQGIAPAGPWFTHHLRMDPHIFDFEIGVPVATPISDSGRVKAGQRPATTVARTVYHGTYEGLGSAWAELNGWIRAEGYAPAPDLWECYVAGPESSPDPAAWCTELSRPLIR
jgi:uncharacterized protein YndB with AHSA1/START domain/effector-binding domain-containing protein